MTLEKGNRSAVVVGGGIGGLSAALALAKRGCRVTVIEQADKFGEIGAGIQIGPNGFHAMDYLGIGERARARAVYIEAIIMMDGMSGEQIFHTPLDDDFKAHYGLKAGDEQFVDAKYELVSRGRNLRREFNIPAIATDRYNSDVTGTFDMMEHACPCHIVCSSGVQPRRA